jgi:aryl-alcohol dehydrogenase-like predicted oxidoreductase
VIASKIPPKNLPQKLTPDTPLTEVFPTDWIVQCTEESLRHLGTDYLDLQQLQRWLPSWLEQPEWYEALQRLQRQGRIRAFGVCASPWDAEGPVELIRCGKTDSVQEHYNLFFQRPPETLFPVAKEHEVGIIVRVPFEEGLLTGRLTPHTHFREGDWRREWLDQGRLEEAGRRLEELKAFLAPDRPTLAALALKFCLSDPAVSTVIPGMRTIAHVEANCAVSEGVLLSLSERRQLREHEFLHGWVLPWLK